MFRTAFVRPASRLMLPRWSGGAPKLVMTTRLSRAYISRATGGSVYTKNGLAQSSLLLNKTIHPMPSVHLGSLCHFSSNQPQRPPTGGNKLTRNIGIAGTTALVLIGKGKYILGALKLTKFASLGSMLLSVGTYSMFFGLPYATGMVALLLVHESGHALAMRSYGIKFSPMVFVPFMGAVISMKGMPRDAWQDAIISLGGPLLGSAGAAAVAVAAQVTQSQLLFALADFGFMINLFNLLPVGVLDGGRIASALSPYAGVAGLGLGGALAYTGTISNPIFYLVLLAGGWETFQRFYNPNMYPPNYHKVIRMKYGFVNKQLFVETIAHILVAQYFADYKHATIGNYGRLLWAHRCVVSGYGYQSKITKATRSVDSRAGDGKIV